MSSKDELRLSQLIQTFGPGAIVDLPDSSVMIRGLDSWSRALASNGMRKINEPRLTSILTKLLKNPAEGESWIAENVSLALYEPPLNGDVMGGKTPPKVPAVVYPRWEVVTDPADLTKQELRRFYAGDKPKRKKGMVVTPVRWVAACSKGHIDDIDWRYFVHQGSASCHQNMYMKDEGAAGDPQYITVSCDCGKSRKLSELYTENALGKCKGHRPWIEGYTATECDEKQRPMTRGAINNYYSQVLKLIALPTDLSDTEKAVSEHLEAFDNVDCAEKALSPIEFGSGAIKKAFAGKSAADIWSALTKMRAANAQTESEKCENPKVEEFSIFASGKELIGENSLNARLHAETLDKDDWRDDDILNSEFISSVVKLHRLCEVSCLYGFTRIEPAPSPFDEIQEDITLEVKGQPLAETISWLPAMEQFGEGIFLKFDADVLRDRILKGDAKSALEAVEQRYKDWQQRDPSRKPFPGAEYVFVHSLSHLLIEQISLEAGYPSTSLSERIYALRPEGSPQVSKLGLLIYAAGGGSQGTLGGLLDQANRIPMLICNGINRSIVCGNDPICSTESQLLVSDSDMINGAACHACLFTAETSCERRNTLLDRISLIELF